MKRALRLCLLVACLTSLITIRPVIASDANAGAKLVQINGCTGCHGATYQGGIGPKLYGIEHRRSALQIAQAIADPKPPMPKVALNKEQIGDIVAYLSSLDGGASESGPIVTLSPAKPSDHATLTVRFPGDPPKHVTALPTMKMGAGTMTTAQVVLHPTSDPHVWKGNVTFSMGGPWEIELVYDGKRLTVPVNVGG